jgi:hypothetical protein
VSNPDRWPTVEDILDELGITLSTWNKWRAAGAAADESPPERQPALAAIRLSTSGSNFYGDEAA